MRRLVGILILASALAVGTRAKHFLFPPVAPDVSVHTASGEPTALVDATRPTAVAFFIQPCGYSDRVLKALQELRTRHSEDELNVVAFYLNPTSDSALTQLRTQRGYDFPLVAAQQTPQLIAQLDKAFAIRGAGVDLYVIEPMSGKIRSVDYSKKDDDADALLAKAEAAVTRPR